MGNSADESKSQPVGALLRAFWITLVFMLVEAAGGVWSNSLALLSDAAHMTSDAMALLLSLAFAWAARRVHRRGDTRQAKKLERWGATINALLVLVLATGIVLEAWVRIHAPEPVRAPMVVGVATLGLLANWASLRILHSSQGESLNVRGAYLHVLSDLMGSVGAIFAGVLIWVTGWALIDPLISILVAALMVFGAGRLLWDVFSHWKPQARADIDDPTHP